MVDIMANLQQFFEFVRHPAGAALCLVGAILFVLDELRRVNK